MVDSRKVLSLDVGKLTDMGQTRAHLFDSLGFFKPDEPDLLYEKGELFIVSDGIGEHEGGVNAARMTTETLIKTYFEKSAAADIETALKHAFNLANMQILKNNEKQTEYVKAGTSTTCAVIQRGTLYIGHIGNCRLYLIKGNKIKQLTTDHLPAVEDDSYADIQQPKSPNLVSQALGWEPNVEIDFLQYNLRPNDSLLLCTDGLYQVLENHEIGRLALKYSPQIACEQLIALANQRGGPDNATTILIKITGLITIPDSLKEPPVNGINLVQPEITRQEPPEPVQRTTMRFNEIKPPQQKPSPIEQPIEAVKPPDKSIAPPVNSYEKKRPEPVEFPPRVTPPPPEPAKSKTSAPKMPDYLDSFQQPPRGIQRRRKTYKPKSQFDFQKYLPVAASIAFALILSITAIYLLIREKNKIAEGTVNNESLLIKASSVTRYDSLAQTDDEETNVLPVEKKGTSEDFKTTLPPATKFSQISLVIINGNRLSGKSVQTLQNRISTLKLENIACSPVNLKSSIRERSKIIYRYPQNGDAQKVRNHASQIQNMLKQQYQKHLEIILCDISIIIGKDFRPGKVDIRQLKRKMLDSNYTSPVNVEILNGSGTGGLANTLKSKLENIFINDKKFIRIIETRNAEHFKYVKTSFKCRPAEIQTATQIARIMGFSTSEVNIETSGLEDIQLIVGRDFPR